MNKINILSRKDLEFSYFCGSGPGGQAKNKVHSGVMIKHKESGACARSSDSRSQEDNKQSAFKKLLAHPKMKFWMQKKLYELRMQETMEEMVDNEVLESKLKVEIKNSEGKWEEVTFKYFESDQAKAERAQG